MPSSSVSKSTVDPSLAPLKPAFDPANAPSAESPHLAALISHLGLTPHIEGGYFVETDRDTAHVIPSPFAPAGSPEQRHASTSIHYLLTPKSPLGAFHRNKGRTVHTLHKGRGRYVILHADEVAAAGFAGGYGDGGEGAAEERRWTGAARVETFVVGPDVLAGERVQWVVEGGKYKSSFLLPDDGEEEEEEEEGGAASKDGLLISETVVPGFEYADHDFMKMERFEKLVEPGMQEEMRWMVRTLE